MGFEASPLGTAEISPASHLCPPWTAHLCPPWTEIVSYLLAVDSDKINIIKVSFVEAIIHNIVVAHIARPRAIVADVHTSQYCHPLGIHGIARPRAIVAEIHTLYSKPLPWGRQRSTQHHVSVLHGQI